MIIIQARTTSQRFPNKVFYPVNGVPLIEYSINAAKKTGLDFCVAIPKDDLRLKEYLQELNIKYFEGSELDVLDRFYQCANYYQARTIIRLCADTLYESSDIEEILQLYQFRRKFTYGNGVFICSFEELKEAWVNAKGDQREHVTTYLYRCIDRYEDVKKWEKLL